MKKIILLLCCFGYSVFGIVKVPFENKDIFQEKKYLENTTNPPILFLFLKISETETVLPSVKLERVLRKKGKVKGDFSAKIAALESQNLVISFYNNVGELIKKTQVENPLAEKVEGVNHHNELEWTTIKRSANSFVVRTQDADDLSFVKIEIIQVDGSLAFLTRIELKNN